MSEQKPITINEAVKNVVGAINLAIVLTSVVCMGSAFVYLVFFENYGKALGFIAFAYALRKLFGISKKSS